MLGAKTQDINYPRGDSKPFQWTVKKDGTVVNITGFTYVMAVNSDRYPTDASNEAFKLTGSIISAVAGRVDFAPSTTNTDLVGPYYYEVQQLDGTVKSTLAKGKITFDQDTAKD